MVHAFILVEGTSAFGSNTIPALISTNDDSDQNAVAQLFENLNSIGFLQTEPPFSVPASLLSQELVGTLRIDDQFYQVELSSDAFSEPVLKSHMPLPWSPPGWWEAASAYGHRAAFIVTAGIRDLMSGNLEQELNQACGQGRVTIGVIDISSNLSG